MTERARQPTSKTMRAALCLLALLLAAFGPAIFGGKTLMLSSWDTPSIIAAGAFDQGERPSLRLQRTSDPGAPAWQLEPWTKLISDQFWSEFNWPLWNPYNAFGTPLAGAQQPQPFFPPMTLLSLHPTAWTYNLFIVGRLVIAALLMYLFAHQFLAPLPSLFSAITFSLCGYFVVFLNMPHVSVEVLMPGLMLACELLLRGNSWKAVAGLAAFIFLGMTGGMPESLFLILVLAGLYFTCRLLFAPELRAHFVSLMSKFVLAVLFGFALSAFLLFPFLEFLRLGHDVHQPSNMGGAKTGLLYDGDYRLTIQYLLPLIIGPVLNSTLSNFAGWSGLKAYWGIVPSFFVVLALLSLSFRNRTPGTSMQRFTIAFFSAMLVLMMLKRFGNVPVNWIGYLPVFDLVFFPKYLEPLIAFCVAMLAGSGFALLIEERITRRQLVATILVTLCVMLLLAGTYLPALTSPALKYANIFFYLSLLGGLFVLAVVAMVSWLARKSVFFNRVWALRAIVVFLSLELIFNFMVPSFYLLNGLPPVGATPYAGAPYIRAITADNADHWRVFGRESVLYPNWSAAFKLMDVRSIDGIFYARYRSFMRSFLLAPGYEDRRHGDLADRFSGQEFAYAFDTDAERRFLALSSIKYLITESDYGISSKIIDDILLQHKDEFIWGFGPDTFTVGNEQETRVRGLLQHPPSSRVSFRTLVDPQKSVFEGVVVIKDRGAEKSDGAGFHLEVREAGRSETLFEAFLDPGNSPSDKAGRPFRVDLKRYAGREIELLFSTDPGPKGDNKGDWAGWAGLRFVPITGSSSASPFRKIYNGEVGIFEVPSVLPRASLYSAIEILPDTEILGRLKHPAFDSQTKAVVSRESLFAASQNEFAVLAQAKSSPVSAAVITQYQSQYVRIEADAPRPCLLVLNDANYPGWQAYVNGRPAQSVMANYLFRGVLVPAGRSTVEFRYEPFSFRAGGVLALVAFAALIGLVYRERRGRGSTVRAQIQQQ